MTVKGARRGERGRTPAITRTLLVASLAALGAHSAIACDFETTAPVRTLTSESDAWRAVTGAMAACGAVESSFSPGFRSAQPEDLAGSPSPYHLGGVANDTIVPLLEAGSIRPLDDLIDKYGGDLVTNQLIRVDGQTMAIAILVRTQHLIYRKDIFDDLGLAPPATWSDALAAAETIRRVRVVDHPIGATMAAGWDLAQDFVNMYLGYGGTLYDGESLPKVSSDAGLRTLQMMQAITAYLGPDYLTSDAATVLRQFQQGQIAMAILWSDHVVALDDPEHSQVVGQVATAPAPRARPDGPPTATLWWEGFVIPKDIPDAAADAAFRAAMQALSPHVVSAHNDAAIWLVPGYQPTRLAEGAIASATATPAPVSYPSSRLMGLMHTALGAELPAFFDGTRSGPDTLAAVEAHYLAAAKDAGLID